VKGEETLQYWGFSYGTVTGLTFASMHPHHVKRLIVDGITNPRTFYTGLWSTDIVDSDLVMRRFSKTAIRLAPPDVYSTRKMARLA
jgi:pimeloyl-ACP methyl ester carboxylesterase